MLGHPRLAGLTVCCACVSACGTHSGAGGASGPCQTIGPAPTSRLPHLTVSGVNATAIVQALDAIFASQTPPLSPGTAYSLPSLTCVDIAVPGDSGVDCSLALGTDGGSQIAVGDTATSNARARDAYYQVAKQVLRVIDP